MMRDKLATGRNGKRRQTLAIVGLAILAAAAYGLYWGLAGRFLESTDNAYVAGNLVQITPQAAGTVAVVRVDDTDLVQVGDTLVTFDPAEMEIALERAEAELAQSVRQVRHLFIGSSQSQANLTQRAEREFRRRTATAAAGPDPQEQLAEARNAVSSAKAGLAVAERFGGNRAVLQNITIDQHPIVRVASARLREAVLALQRTTIRSPVRGYVAKRSVQIGSRVGAGVPLMAIVPLSEVWAEANFKESQLRDLRIGQPVTLSADVYGSEVQYKGSIVGMSAGTGSAFSLLPAQNATGNWIKVVQRLPVRVALDPHELASHPLRVGLSLQVVVDTRDRSGLTLAAVPRSTAPLALPSQRAVQDADARIDRIIRANDGERPHCSTIAPRSPRCPGNPFRAPPKARMNQGRV